MPSLSLKDTAGVSDPDFQLQVGSVVRRSVSVWGASFFPFLVMGFLFYLPMAFYFGALVATNATAASFQVFKTIESLYSGLVNLALGGAVTYGVFQHLRGHPADTGSIIRAGLRHFGSVWVVSLLSGLAIGLGLLCLIVPGLYFMCSYWVAVPVAVIEQPGASASLSRSSELTDGNRWRILGILLINGALLLVAMIAVGLVLFAVITAIGVKPEGPRGAAASDVAATLGLLPLRTLYAVMAVVGYHDLRVGREGVDTEELIKVFE
ncbi:MAG TPA: hypothetical protein VGN09_17090 [Vicinamibacteria bacterium]